VPSKLVVAVVVFVGAVEAITPAVATVDAMFCCSSIIFVAYGFFFGDIVDIFFQKQNTHKRKNPSKN
jgi:hypothetical protein